MPLLSMLLLLSTSVLRDDVFPNAIPPGHWRYDRFTVTTPLPAEVECRFRVERGGPVRVELLSADNLAALLKKQPYDSIAHANGGTLRYRIGVPGAFAIAVFNEDAVKPAEVMLRLALKSSQAPESVLSPRKKITVIALSTLGFFAILFFSGRALIAAMRASGR